jgi:hypothetical protein
MAIGVGGARLWLVAGIDQTANRPEPDVDLRWRLSSTSTSTKLRRKGAPCVGCVSRSSVERLYGDWSRRCAAVASGRNRPDRQQTRTRRRSAMASFEHEHEHEHEYEYEHEHEHEHEHEIQTEGLFLCFAIASTRHATPSRSPRIDRLENRSRNATHSRDPSCDSTDSKGSIQSDHCSRYRL